VPIPAGQPSQPPASDASTTVAPTSRARGTRRGGIPQDIVDMMTKVFGEGVTYTEIADGSEADEEDAALADLAEDASTSQGEAAAQAYDGGFVSDPEEDFDD
jgi:hypothetical protein